MNNKLALTGTLLRKDLRLFWPFAGLIALLHFVQQLPDVIALLGTMAGIMQVGLQLGTVLLILVVCYEDAVVSLKHDWLTRPIPGPILLLAKSLFVFLAIIAPAILGALAHNLWQGRSVGEALLAGLSAGARGNNLVVYALIMAFAAVTASLRQAVIVFLAGLAAMGVATGIINLLRQIPDSPGTTPSAWIISRTMVILLAVAAVSMLWVQFRHRHTRAARGIAAVAVVCVAALSLFMTWRPVFALQKMLAPDPDSAASIKVALADGCFPARVLDEPLTTAADEATARLTVQRYAEGHREFAGPGAIAFSTRLIAQGVPEQRIVTVDHVGFGYFAGGPELLHTRPSFESSQWMAPAARPAADQFWLLSRAGLTRLAATANVETRLDFSLSLLAPVSSAQFVADGRRAHYPGIGYCDARFDRSLGRVLVSCFTPGAQPALLVAKLEGAAESANSAGWRADFTPAVLDFWGGSQHRIQLTTRGGEVPSVTLTAYEARAHFDRQVVVPGVLGGPASACPLPSTSEKST